VRLTNRAGLPDAVFEALKHKEYSRGDADISVTELIDSPRVRILKKLNDDKIEREAETLLAPFLGTAFHKAIETGTKTGTAERRLSCHVSGWKISGGMDHYHDGVITDYKTATCYKVSLDCPNGRIEDYENQLNVYAYILRENGFSVTEAKIFVLFKDWNRRSFSEAVKKGKIFVPYQQGGYPEKTWAYFKVLLWGAKEAQGYVEARVRAHQMAKALLPLCTEKEIWRGNRCKSYCDVAPFCTQFKEQSKTGIMKKEII